MSSFNFFLFCAHVCLIANVYGQYCGAGLGYGAGVIPTAVGLAPGLAAAGVGPSIAAASLAPGFAGASLAPGLTAINSYGLGAGLVPEAYIAEIIGAYGGAGVGDVAVVGEMPVAGTTLVAGQVPILGAVRFAGDLPAAGKVSISGSCGCGCGNAPYAYYK